MKNTTRFFGYLLVVIGIIGYIIFSRYKGELIPYPLVWTILSIIVFLLGINQIRKSYKQEIEKKDNDFKKKIAEFKSKAEKIRVDLLKCDVKSINYAVNVEKNSFSTINMLDSIYDPNYNSKSVQNVNLSIIVFATERQGQKIEYGSQFINKDEITIKFLMGRQKETYIYIDKFDKDEYYFDIEFLNEEEN